MPPYGANEAAPTTTTSRPPAIRNADEFNRPRRSMSGLSPAGTEVAQGCARALQKRSDIMAARQGSHLKPCSSPRSRSRASEA